MFNKLLAILAFCLVTQLSIAQERLTVQVLDKTGKPAHPATVRLDSLSTTTNEAGYAEMTNLKNQQYQLSVSYVGYRDLQRSINPATQQQIQVQLDEETYRFEEIFISATRAKENSATTFKTIGKQEIRERNLGQDIPYLLDQTPGVVIGSDAGAGIGYTNMTIRGSDNERINVTLNGVPLNNPESMGSFFVNLPDFASSTQSIQVQRGIGTSTNGPSAFGASLNIQTDALETEPYVEFNNSFGSYNSWKNTLKIGSGLIADRYAFNARLSRIRSDGYVDRASSNLQSFYVDGGLFTDQHTLKATVFSGKEKTYQSWYGLAEPLLTGNHDRLDAYADNLGLFGQKRDRFLSGDRRYNYYTYDNQTDNYLQTHAHLQYAYRPSEKLAVNTTFHYTKGAGYYEEYRDSDDLGHYQIAPVTIGDSTIDASDLIRRRWLDNHFYGLTYSLQYRPNEGLDLTFGGAYNRYDGKHYGEVIWARYASDSEINDHYYDNDAQKSDFNLYAKADYRTGDFLFNIDLQYRTIDYQGKGDDDKIKNLDFKDQLHFFNPKLGMTYFLSPGSNLYASYAFAGKEPTRNDYVENPRGEFPKAEMMQNIEAGYRYQNESVQIGANLYGMFYTDQLIPTGTLNDVGTALRVNVDNSYRAGLELDGSWQVTPHFIWRATAALSQNKIKEFGEHIPVYDPNFSMVGEAVIEHGSTTIAKSPSTILSNNFTLQASQHLSLSLISKYVSRIYLDNTSAKSRSIDPWLVNNLQAMYSFSAFGIERIDLNLLVNNIFNTKYANSGYTYSMITESTGQRDDFNFYYPQAETNAMLGVNIRF
ncbi:MAG: TonB-dependent receptor [Sphingobacterium sp.]